LQSRAVTLDPANAASLNNLGNVLIDLHRFEDAVDALRRAAALRPEGSGHARQSWAGASVLQETRRSGGSLSGTPSRSIPSVLPAHASLGNVLTASKDDAGALTAFAAALDLAPNRRESPSTMSRSRS